MKKGRHSTRHIVIANAGFVKTGRFERIGRACREFFVNGILGLRFRQSRFKHGANWFKRYFALVCTEVGGAPLSDCSIAAAMVARLCNTS